MMQGHEYQPSNQMTVSVDCDGKTMERSVVQSASL